MIVPDLSSRSEPAKSTKLKVPFNVIPCCALEAFKCKVKIEWDREDLSFIAVCATDL